MKTPKKNLLLKGDEATPRHVVNIMKKSKYVFLGSLYIFHIVGDSAGPSNCK